MKQSVRTNIETLFLYVKRIFSPFFPQAAGAGAALAVKKGISPREIEKEANIKELQSNLLTQGVILYGVK